MSERVNERQRQIVFQAAELLALDLDDDAYRRRRGRVQNWRPTRRARRMVGPAANVFGLSESSVLGEESPVGVEGPVLDG